MTDAPVGSWAEVALENLIEPLQSGSRPKGGVRNIDEGVPSLGGEHLNSTGGFNFTNLRYVPRAFYESMKRGRIRPGDILVVKDGATTGKVSLVGSDFPYQEAVVNEHVFICRPLPSVSSEFLFSYLYSPQGQERILENFQGAAQGGINQSFAARTMIPVPPADQQERILSWLTAGLKKQLEATDHARRAARRLGVLDLAFLRSAYDQALEAADGHVTPLNDLLAEPLRNGYSARPVPHETKYRVLTLTATTSGRFDPRHFKYTEDELPADAHSWVRHGDILVQRGNTEEYVGVSALYEGESHAFIYPDLMIRVRVREDIGARFVAHMLLAPPVRQYMRDRATGAAGNMPKINQQTLGDVPIPVPDEKIRADIVARLEAAFELCTNLRAGVGRVERQCLSLESALLAKAFRGELVTHALGEG